MAKKCVTPGCERNFRHIGPHAAYKPLPAPASSATCPHGDDPAQCISCEMLAKRPDKEAEVERRIRYLDNGEIDDEPTEAQRLIEDAEEAEEAGVEVEREEFEAWAKSRFLLHWDDERKLYSFVATDNAWRGWQAARASRQTK